MGTGRSPPTQESEDQQPPKQRKTTRGALRTGAKQTVQPSEPEAWLPAPMLGGEPLRAYASIREYSGGIGCNVASALEETLLLPRDMAELKKMKKDELFMNIKRHLGMV